MINSCIRLNHLREASREEYFAFMSYLSDYIATYGYEPYNLTGHKSGFRTVSMDIYNNQDRGYIRVSYYHNGSGVVVRVVGDYFRLEISIRPLNWPPEEIFKLYEELQRDEFVRYFQNHDQ
jgi:hypothetical protein